MADKRVVVTGLGLVCVLGNDVQTCWSKAVNGVTGIDDVKSVDTANCYAHKGAEVDLPNEALSSENYDRSSLLCIKATAQAVEDAKLDIKSEDSSRIGVILGSCVGGAASIDKYYTDEIKGGESDEEGIVEFEATYSQHHTRDVHHETAYFKKVNGDWMYSYGAMTPTTVVRETPKVGRNEPCPCGSGKKYKNCCGKNA